MKKIVSIILVCLFAAAGFGCAFFESPEERVARYVSLNQSQIREIADSAKDVMDISCFAEGKAMVIQYDYLKDTGADAASISGTLDSVGGTYKKMYDELARFAHDEDVSVILRYNGPDGARIFDYVVDKDYVPGENAGEVDINSMKTVEDYVRSDAFRAMISAQDDEYFAYTADVENGSTVVVFHTLKNAYSAEELANIKADWDASMQETGPEAVSNMKTAVGLVVKDTPITVVYRLVDSEGNVVSEYSGE